MSWRVRVWSGGNPPTPASWYFYGDSAEREARALAQDLRQRRNAGRVEVDRIERGNRGKGEGPSESAGALPDGSAQRNSRKNARNPGEKPDG